MLLAAADANLLNRAHDRPQSLSLTGRNSCPANSRSFSYHWLRFRLTLPPMPRIKKNAPRPNNPAPLCANDLFALRDFVNKRLSQPSALSDQLDNPLPLAKLIEADPQLYNNAIDLLSAGHSPQAVANATGLPLQTVTAATWFIPDYKAICRTATAKNLAIASLTMSESLAQRSDKLPPDKIAFALSVAIEKSELLSGGVTVRTEKRQVVSREELKRLFEQLPRAKARDVTITDPSPHKKSISQPTPPPDFPPR